MYTLHGFSQSGNTYKVALTLQVLGVPWQAKHLPFTEFAGGLTRSDRWRDDLNEMGEVPILDTEDGRRLTQSAAIMLHLAERHGRFRGETDDERHQVLRWLFFDNHKFTSYFATWRFMKAFAGTAPDPTMRQWFQGRIENAFGIVDKHLARTTWMAGGAQPTIADLSLCGYLYFPTEESGIDIAARYPAIAAWLARIRALPGWQGPYELLPGEQVPAKW